MLCADLCRVLQVGGGLCLWLASPLRLFRAIWGLPVISLGLTSQKVLLYSLLLPSNTFRRKKKMVACLRQSGWTELGVVIVRLSENTKENWQVVMREALAGVLPQ